MLAAGLNPVDAGLASRGPFPRVLGLEDVVELDGQVVYAERAVQPHGTYAGRAVVTAADTIVLPRDLDPAAAIPLGIAGLAGWIPIETTAALVLGATGQVALHAARLLGAGRIVAVGRRSLRH